MHRQIRGPGEHDGGRVSGFKTIQFEAAEGVGWVTLNRPDVYNAFDATMRRELSELWQRLRTDDDVRCVVLTGAGEKAFCTGIDRSEIPEDATFDPLNFDDPGKDLGPKSNGLLTPVIAAVNGMACGGAFYLLGEVDFIVAAEHATFFDPHVTYGMTAVYEPILMMSRMPWGELMRMTLLGAHERMSAQRAHQIGLVSEVVPAGDLKEAAARAARAIASQPARTVQATVRALWAARELGTARALELGGELLNLGTSAEALKEGQDRFASGQRVDWWLR
jgi:enoyl-CoA hydratase/carnithine racemase